MPELVLRANVESLTRTLDWASNMPSLRNFIFASTSEVYAGSVQEGLAIIPTPENSTLAVRDPKDARGTYALSKIYGEALCEHSGLPYTVVRPHNVYGPRMGMSHVIPQLFYKAWRASHGSAIGVSSLKHSRTFMYVDDAIAFLERIASKPGSGLVVNLGNDTPEVSIENLARQIIEVTGKNLNIIELPAMHGSPSRRAPQTRTLKLETGLVSEISLREGLEKTYSWYEAYFTDNCDDGNE